MDRRFQLAGSADGVTVIDDYGHHPTEIRATLAAARQCGFGRVHVIFQPHRYTRTQVLMDEFATAFPDADSVLLLDIYPASEPPIPGITGEMLANRITESGGQEALYVASFAEATELASLAAEPGDMILTLGAGSIFPARTTCGRGPRSPLREEPRIMVKAGIKDLLMAINRAQADGVIDQFAIGGTLGAIFYIEPTIVPDAEIFVKLPRESAGAVRPACAYL